MYFCVYLDKRETLAPVAAQGFRLEQVKGIEPSCSAWEADILPLNYTCASWNSYLLYHRLKHNARKIFGGIEIKISKDKYRKIQILLLCIISHDWKRAGGFRLQEIRRARRPRRAVPWRQEFYYQKQLKVKESPRQRLTPLPAPFNKGAFGAGPGSSSTQAPLVKGGCPAGAGGFRFQEIRRARRPWRAVLWRYLSSGGAGPL